MVTRTTSRAIEGSTDFQSKVGGTGRRAYALLDVLVAGVLLGIVLVAVMGLTSQALSSQTKGEQLQTAAMLADERMNLVLMTGPDRYEGNFQLEGECDAPFDSFRYRVEIESGAEGAAWPVRVVIAWKSLGGEQSFALDARLAPRLGDDPDPDRKPAETISREDL